MPIFLLFARAGMAVLFDGAFSVNVLNVAEENFSYLLNNSKNFNEIFRKNVTSDYIKSHKTTGLHPLFKRYIFGKTTGRGVKLTQLFKG